MSTLTAEEIELKEVQAKRKALEARRADGLSKTAATRQLAAEKQALADDEAILQAECELGEQGVQIACLRTPKGVVILKRAPYALYRQFQENEAKAKISDLETLVSKCRVYPDAIALDGRHTEFPGLLMRCVAAIGVLAGAVADDNVKK